MKKVNKKGLMSKKQQTQAQLEKQQMQQQQMQQKAQKQSQQQQSLAQSIQVAMQEDGYTIEDVVTELKFNDVQDQEIFQALSELGYNQNQIVALLQEKQTETPTADSLYKAQKGLPKYQKEGEAKIISGSKDGSYHQQNADGSITVMDNWGTTDNTRKKLNSALLQSIINRQKLNNKPINYTNPFLNFYQQNYIPSTINTYPNALGKIGFGLSKIFGAIKNSMQTGGGIGERAEELRITSTDDGKYAEESFWNVKGKFMDQDVTYQYVRKIPRSLISDTPTSLPNKTNDIPTINLTEEEAEGVDETKGMSNEMIVELLKRTFIDPITRVGQGIYDVGEDVVTEAMREKPEMVVPEEEPQTSLDVNQILDAEKSAVFDVDSPPSNMNQENFKLQDFFKSILNAEDNVVDSEQAPEVEDKEINVPPEEREYDFENQGFRTKKNKIQATEKFKDLLENIRQEEYPDVPLPVLMSIMAIESAGNVKGDSGAAKGLMQIVRGTWSQRNADRKKEGKKTYKYDDYKYDPKINILYGIETLKAKAKKLGLKPTDENYMEMVIAAYNGGEGIVGDAIKIAKSKGQNGNKDWLLLENMIPAVAKYNTWEYYYNQRGKIRNKHIDQKTGKPKPKEEELAKKEAIRLKAKEISNYPPKFKAYLKYFDKYYKKLGGENTLKRAQTAGETEEDYIIEEEPFEDFKEEFDGRIGSLEVEENLYDLKNKAMNTYTGISGGIVDVASGINDLFDKSKTRAAKNRLRSGTADQYSAVVDPEDRGLYDENTGQLMIDKRASKYPRYIRSTGYAQMGNGEFLDPNAYYSAYGNPMYDFFMDNKLPMYQGNDRLNETPDFNFNSLSPQNQAALSKVFQGYGLDDRGFINMDAIMQDTALNQQQRQTIARYAANVNRLRLEREGMDYVDESVSRSKPKQTFLPTMYTQNSISPKALDVPRPKTPPFSPEQYAMMYNIMMKQGKSGIPSPMQGDRYEGYTGPMFQEQKRYGGPSNPFMRSKMLRKKGGRVAKVSSSVLSKLIAKGANVKEI